MPLSDPAVEVEERGLQHLVLIDRRRGVVARFPRREEGCLHIADAAARLDLLRRHGLPVPEVLGATAGGGRGRAHLLLRLVPGSGLDTVDTDALQPAARARLVGGLVDTTAQLHRIPTAQWPTPGPTWSQLWSDLLAQIHGCTALQESVRDQQSALAAAALDVARRARIGIFHGDLGGVNCRVDPESGAVLALLDWDSAAVGDVATDLVALLHGVGPLTASELRAADPRWDAAWHDYPAYVATWPVQCLLWSMREGKLQDRAAALALLTPSAQPVPPR